MENDVLFVNRKQLQVYLGVSEPTALKKYRQYKESLGKQEFQELTVYDLASIDNLPVRVVKSRLGY